MAPAHDGALRAPPGVHRAAGTALRASSDDEPLHHGKNDLLGARLAGAVRQERSVDAIQETGMSLQRLNLLGYVAAEFGGGGLDFGDQRLASVDEADDIGEVGTAD